MKKRVEVDTAFCISNKPSLEGHPNKSQRLSYKDATNNISIIIITIKNLNDYFIIKSNLVNFLNFI